MSSTTQLNAASRSNGFRISRERGAEIEWIEREEGYDAALQGILDLFRTHSRVKG